MTTVRLFEKEIEIIVKAVKKFDEEAEIYLSGSRVDDRFAEKLEEVVEASKELLRISENLNR